jgi:TonB family protein
VNHMKLFLSTLVLSGLILIQAAVTRGSAQPQEPIAADPARANAEKLYQEKRYAEAANAFKTLSKKYPNDFEILMRLGMSNFSLGKMKDAGSAFETAAKLQPDSEAVQVNLGFIYLNLGSLDKAERAAEALLKLNANSIHAWRLWSRVRLRQDNAAEALQYAEKVIQTDNSVADAHLVKTQALMRSYMNSNTATNDKPLDKAAAEKFTEKKRELLRQAAASLETYLSLANVPKYRETLQQQIIAMRAYGNGLFPDAVGEIVSAPSVRPNITYKEIPRYTDDARKIGIEGTVLVAVIFSTDGTIRYPLVVRSLEAGLDEKALQAALKVKFVPAKHEGREVAMRAFLEFTFNLH